MIPPHGQRGRPSFVGVQPVLRNVWVGAIGVAAVLFAAGSARAAETPFEPGSYLVNTIAAGGRCHTPRDAQGKPIGAMALAGGFAFDANRRRLPPNPDPPFRGMCQPASAGR
jgi:hypothetical protein